jgi:hypothetical protein
MVLPQFAGEIVSVAAAQPAEPRRASETATPGELERLRLTLALARSYRLTGEPQRAWTRSLY